MNWTLILTYFTWHKTHLCPWTLRGTYRTPQVVFWNLLHTSSVNFGPIMHLIVQSAPTRPQLDLDLDPSCKWYGSGPKTSPSPIKKTAQFLYLLPDYRKTLLMWDCKTYEPKPEDRRNCLQCKYNIYDGSQFIMRVLWTMA